MVDLPELAGRFRNFVDTTASRAPLYSRLSASVAEDDALLELLMAAPDAQRQPVLLFAAVHDLLLAGSDPELAAFYPNFRAGGAEGDPVPAFRRFALERSDEIRSIVATRSTQTNEVGRCAQFVPAMGLLEAEVGALAMIDVGTSAGLNLLLPRYSYRYDPGGDVGAPSPVHLRCRTSGNPPIPSRLPHLAAAVGLDRSPIDVRDDDAVRWLEACVWPDQADRFARLVEAIALARAEPPDVRQGDALTDVTPLVDEMAAHGHPVVTNSWVLNYLSPAMRERYVANLDEAGTRGDLSWIVAESPAQTPELPVPSTDPPEEITVVSLVRWRSGVRSVQRLATTHPHGYWLHWETPLGD